LLLKSLKVKDAMMDNVFTVEPGSTIVEVEDIFKSYKAHAVPVVDDGKLVGIVAKRDVMDAISSKQPITSVIQIMSSNLVVTYPDESLFDAMNKMVINDIGQLPVVERNRPQKLIGVLALDDVTRIQCQEIIF
jgi:CIC family chloride channel protein